MNQNHELYLFDPTLSEFEPAAKVAECGLRRLLLLSIL